MPLLVNDVAADPRYVSVVPGHGVGAGRAAAAQEAADRRAQHPQPPQGSVHPRRDVRAAAPVRGARRGRHRQRAARSSAAAADADAFETLAEIGRDVASVLDLDELFARIAQSTRGVIDYRTFGILARQRGARASSRSSSRCKCGEKVARAARRRSARGSSATPRCTSEPVLVADVLAGSALHQRRPDVRSELAIPMLLKDRCIGVRRSREPGARRVHQARRRDPHAARPARPPWRSRTRGSTRRCAPTRCGSRRKCASPSASRRRCCRCGLPKRMKGVEVGARFAPARELGGDFHDFLSPEANTLAVALGDVSGKGVPGRALQRVRGGADPRTHVPAPLPARSLRPGGGAVVGEHDPAPAAARGVLLHRSATPSSISKRRVVTLANSGLPYPIRASAEGVSQIELPGVPLGSFHGSTLRRADVSRCTPGTLRVLHGRGLRR